MSIENSNLHSNLVIFKQIIGNMYENKELIFTFQSGDIQIAGRPWVEDVAQVNLHSNLVIFKLL